MIPQQRGVMNQQSLPAVPLAAPAEEHKAEPRNNADSYQDSLDAYLSPQPPQENISQVGAATMDVPRRAPPPAEGRDSLDDYLTHSRPQPTQERQPPAQQPPR